MRLLPPSAVAQATATQEQREGKFDIKFYSSKTNVRFAVQLRIRIPQRDTKLIELLLKYFSSGSIEKIKIPCGNFGNN